MATEEMRQDFDEMAALNKRPNDYQLKVRTHPGMLAITALTKMRGHEKISSSYFLIYYFKSNRPTAPKISSWHCGRPNENGIPVSLSK
jgi:hypothetical protein